MNKNKNKMNMDAMKRAAKVLMKGGGDLNAVVIDQRSMLDVFDKFIPTINNVGSALLKWSYTEMNYTFPDVFSAWADLDHGFTQLLQEFAIECSRYRKTFKDIIAESKKVSEAQKEKEKTAGKVSSLQAKLESARKAAKKNDNDKARQQVSNLESDLSLAKSKDNEMEDTLRNAISDFEHYKAFMVKESLTVHCQTLMALLHKGTDLCQTKLDIAETMPSTPASAPDAGGVNSRRVEELFSKHNLQLPTRDVAVARNLPLERFKTMPTPPPYQLGLSPKMAKHVHSPHTMQNTNQSRPFAGVQVFGQASDSGSDYEDDYMMPNEDMIAKSAEKTKPPELPPRNVIEEEEYVVPNLSPNPHTPNQFSPTQDGQTDYFQVASDSEAQPPVKPSLLKSPKTFPVQREVPAPIDEPVYSAPPEDEEEEEGGGDQPGRLYGNMSNEDLTDHKRAVSAAIPARPQGKPRRPAVYPKPPQRLSAALLAPKSPDTICPVSPATADNEDFYSLVCEDTPNNGQTGVCPAAPSRPRTLSSESNGDAGTPGSGQSLSLDPLSRPIQHTYMAPVLRSQESLDKAGMEADSGSGDEGVRAPEAGYVSCADAGRQQSYESEQMYGNVPEVYLTMTGKQPSPVPVRKPAITARKPRVPARSGVR